MEEARSVIGYSQISYSGTQACLRNCFSQFSIDAFSHNPLLPGQQSKHRLVFVKDSILIDRLKNEREARVRAPKARQSTGGERRAPRETRKTKCVVNAGCRVELA